ncbi:sensor histidine kinase [Chryseobacterium sp.]|uniref:sensor histidine kinase n=1 Tax=Chryseobacterium sp. TaxID=1871047 RepID=UPI0038903B10
MKISLKYYTIKYLTLILLAVIAVWAALYYAYILDEVYDNVDDGLKNRKIQLIKAVYVDPNLLKNNEFGFNEFNINPVSPLKYTEKNKLYNKMYYMEYDDEDEPYRVLETDFIDQYGKYQKLVVRTSTVEEDELIYDLTTALVILYFLLVISVILVNGLLLNKALKPFYHILNNLKKYQFGQHSVYEKKTYAIKEFNDLNTEIEGMIGRNELVFLQQKQFIENASHELQTPLAIAINKLDFAMRNDELSEDHLKLMSEVKSNLSRMTSLNKSLLMLSKIENNQFNKSENIIFNDIIKELLLDYEDYIEHKEITTHVIEEEKFSANFDPDLAIILLSNLLKNAIRYNKVDGELEIEIKENLIIVKNTGLDAPLDQAKIFNRFYKQGTEQSSTGLGLSIIKTIIKQYPNWDIVYEYNDGYHCFMVSKK